MNNIVNSNHKTESILSKLVNYFIIISFLFPRGYAEFDATYKMIFTCCIWISTLIIWIQFFLIHFKFTIKKDSLSIINYFIALIVITFLIRGLSITGYQRLITYPSICLFTIYNLKKNPKSFLNTVNNVVVVLLILNQLVLRNFFSQQYHITFLGHVQMISQLGVLSIFCALIFWMMFHERKKRTIFIVILSVFTMITTDASSAVISAIILCIFAFLYKLRIYRFLTYNSKVYIIIGMIFSGVIVFLSVINNLNYNNEISFLDFSGRSFVWIDALSKIRSNIIFGHGLEGVLLDVFWNQWVDSTGFNYAHNQILQNLLDGGVIIFILFLLMLFAFCKNTKKIIVNKVNANEVTH